MSLLERRWYSDEPAPCLLRPFSYLYSVLSQRKKRNDLQQQWHASVPVIVVGNISVGGTGKTPLTVSLIERLKAEGFSPGIISRGYKAKAPCFPFDVSLASGPEACGDEPFMLAQKCQCPVVIDPDRPAAAAYLLEKFQCDLLISDDGLQHYRLGRDIEIAVVDGVRGLGNQALLPAGPLREVPSRLEEVDFVVTNGALSTALNLVTPCFEMSLVPSNLMHCSTGEVASVESFKGNTVHAVAGIGNPQRFFSTLELELGLTVIPHAKADHSFYTEQDFKFDDQYPIFMTEKDAVKVADLSIERAWYLQVNAQLPEIFYQQLLAKIKTVFDRKGKTQNG